MRVVWLVLCVIALSSLARAEDSEDVVDMISQYRRAHGLSTVKVDPKLTAIAERQAKAMAATGIMDHNIAGPFVFRIADAHLGMASENLAAGTKTWAETFRLWQNSPGHNANLLQSKADSIGVAVARNGQTRYKTFWAMLIADKPPKAKDRKTTTADGTTPSPRGTSHSSGNPLTAIKKLVCKFFC
ncbi:MAG TPA: CAP domain-containing protein [Pirellulales bacterium]